MNKDKTALTILKIDLAALRDNITHIQRLVGKHTQVAGVVKANAYGLGLAEIARVHQACGTRRFFVATPDEGIALRAVLGAGPEIAILGGVFPGMQPDYVEHRLIPVLNTLESMQGWGGTGPAMLHIDTGMRRLGLDVSELEMLRNDPALCQSAPVIGLISHFACADEPGHPLTVQQFEAFRRVMPLFPAAQKSISNSAGIFASRDYDLDFVRPGMAVYGLNPTPGKVNPMAPVVSLHARVLQVRQAQSGDGVGYGATYRCAGDQRVATIALGYADGFLRSLSNRGQVFWNGLALPIIGRVSMDLVTLDVQAAPALKAGDWVEVLGPHQDADTLATHAGTIGYEILTSLGQRYRREYLS